MHIDSVFPPSSTGYSKPQSDVHGPFNLLRKSRNLRRTACTLPRSLPLPSIGKCLILWYFYIEPVLENRLNIEHSCAIWSGL